MTPTRILTVCIGISAYRSAALDPDERPLRFPADSARDLSGYFSAIWPGPGCRHLLLVDEAASLANIGSRLAAETDRFDFCILYLGGHARGGAGPYEFVFAGDSPAAAAGSSGVIDAIVAMPRADNVVLFLDTGNAGRYADESAFFRAASAAGARICIASCRKGQSSREDPQARRSHFADAVLGAFAADNVLDRLAAGDAAGLLRGIAARLARHRTALQDDTAQEPVLLETSRAAPARTVGRARAGSKRKRMQQLLLRRDVLLALASTSLLVVLAAGLLTLIWHPAINESGHVELRRGPGWLSFLPVHAWPPRVETDAAPADLADAAIAAGAARDFSDAGSHLWTGMNAAGVRRWSDVLLERYLDSEAAARWRVRLGYDGAVERLIAEDGSGGNGVRAAGRPLTGAAATGLAAEARLLDPGRPPSDVWRWHWSDSVAAGGCDGAALPDEAVARLDRYLRLTDPDAAASWLRGLALTARHDDAIGMEEVARLVETFTAAHAVWRRRYMGGVAGEGAAAAGNGAARDVARPAAGEVDALAAVAAAIVARRLAQAQAPVGEAELARLRELLNGCDAVAIRVLAALGRHGDPARVIA